MTGPILRLILRLSPADFRARCGDELLEAHAWRAERRGAGARALLALREVVGLSGIVFRLRATELVRRMARRHPDTGLPGPDPKRWAGPFLAGGVVLVVVGESLAWGAGVNAGHSLVPFAMCALAWGLVGRAVANGRLSSRNVTLARLTAILATAIAVLGVVSGLAPAPIGPVAWLLMYPAVLGFVAASIGFCLRGARTRELPRWPAAATALGTALLATGFAGEALWGVALVGQFMALGGWIGLAVMPWGDEPASPRSHAGVA